MAAATLVGAQSDAMREAAKYSAGALTGFMGMGMAQNAGNMNANELFGMAQKNKQEAEAKAREDAEAQKAEDTWTCSCGKVVSGKFCAFCGSAKPEPAAGWVCSCGHKNKADSKFCPECGAKKPETGWRCTCGAVNQGKFCAECGAKKPAGALLYRCDKCGWMPADPTKPPRFCPECGDIFDERDAK